MRHASSGDDGHGAGVDVEAVPLSTVMGRHKVLSRHYFPPPAAYGERGREVFKRKVHRIGAEMALISRIYIGLMWHNWHTISALSI